MLTNGRTEIQEGPTSKQQLGGGQGTSHIEIWERRFQEEEPQVKRLCGELACLHVGGSRVTDIGGWKRPYWKVTSEKA